MQGSPIWSKPKQIQWKFPINPCVTQRYLACWKQFKRAPSKSAQTSMKSSSPSTTTQVPPQRRGTWNGQERALEAQEPSQLKRVTQQVAHSPRTRCHKLPLRSYQFFEPLPYQGPEYGACIGSQPDPWQQIYINCFLFRHIHQQNKQSIVHNNLTGKFPFMSIDMAMSVSLQCTITKQMPS